MALYRSPVTAADKSLPRRLGAQLGLHRLDGNWLADEDGISRITVAAQPRAGRTGRPRPTFPTPTAPSSGTPTATTTRRQRRIHGMILHCVQPAREGGETTLMDHEMAYIALRDADPRWVRALMADDAMTIPARAGRGRRGACGAVRAGVLGRRRQRRAAHALHRAHPQHRMEGRCLHARGRGLPARSCWAATRRTCLRLRLQPGMGLVGHNVLHERSAFVDDPAAPGCCTARATWTASQAAG